MKKLNHSTHSIHLNESIHKENYSHLLEEANHNNVIKQYNKNELFQAEHDILDYVNKLKRKTILSIDEGNAPPIKPKSRNSALTINSHQIDPTNKIKLQKENTFNEKNFTNSELSNIDIIIFNKKVKRMFNNCLAEIKRLVYENNVAKEKLTAFSCR